MSTTLPSETTYQRANKSRLAMDDADEGDFDLVGILLAEQQSLSAVEAFSEAHDRMENGPGENAGPVQQDSEPDQAVYYRRLMPATQPAEDQQYAFEVDLDACSGCKACVVACHTLNGLEETESWRKVGTLTIGEPTSTTTSDPLPIAIAPESTSASTATLQTSGVQHVTTACHHCEDPGCLNGCPVKAYDKDPVTGIVRHLDDQCIGCKYCTMMCPYEVPKYSKRLGIVRKCDMCHQRLSVGEAPACVQSCPNEAIAIRTVSTGQEFAISDRLVAGAPVSSITKPTTQYVGKRSEAMKTAVPQDLSIDPVAESHWPLAVMLVATQISVAMVLIERLAASVGWVTGNPISFEATRLNATIAFAIGMVGLNLAPLHLGQPLRAWRVFLGLRTSWLSREAIILGKYVGALTAAVALMWLPVAAQYTPEWITEMIPSWVVIPSWADKAALGTSVLLGIAGLYSSAMIYIATKRKLWRSSRTLPRFFGTGVVVGAAATALAFWIMGESSVAVISCLLLAALSATIKLCWEGSFHLHRDLTSPNYDSLDARAHRLMTNELDTGRRARLLAGWVGVVFSVVSIAVVASQFQVLAWGLLPIAVIGLLAGEILERLLYFMSVVYDRMPGTLR